LSFAHLSLAENTICRKQEEEEKRSKTRKERKKKKETTSSDNRVVDCFLMNVHIPKPNYTDK